MIRILIASSCLFVLTGCSSLGISLYPTGHFLTRESKDVLEQAPSRAPLPRELNLSVVPAHHLQPGDALLIEPVVFSDNVRLPADQQVLADGTIDLGGFGRLQVAGMTLEDVESGIEQRLVAMEAESAQVNVRLLNSVDRYYVLGEVQSPGAYPLTGNETVLDGILQAGGLTDLAAPCKILLARPTPPPSCRIVLPVCYRQLTQLGDTSTNYQLQPGDRVYVASRTCCEELMFWRASRTCEKCCGNQSACCHPQVYALENPVSVVLPTPPHLPNWSQDPKLDRPAPLRMQNGLIESSPSNPPMDLAPASDHADPNIESVPRLPVPQNDTPNSTEPPAFDGELDFDSPLEEQAIDSELPVEIE